MERIAKGQAYQRVIGPDSCFGNQVRGSDRIDITGRIEDIPEREGGRQLSFEELLPYR